MLGIIKLLLGPDTPVWVKLLLGAFLLALLVAWWVRPYWQDLDKRN